MTDSQLSDLATLQTINPDVANMVAEFQRLANHTDNPDCRHWLEFLVSGWLSTVNNPCTPWLDSLVIPGGKTAKGYETEEASVSDISLANVRFEDGTIEPFSLWFCPSFAHRLQFLKSGALAVGYVPNVICPIKINIAPDELGFNLE